MKFKTKQEKRAFRMGCAVGSKNKCRTVKTRKNKTSGTHTKPKARAQSPDPFFTNDFAYTDTGHIKGHYTVDGFYEPD